MTNSEPTTEPIRLGLAITELAVAGAERCLVQLATGLDHRRFAAEVYSLAPRPTRAQSELVERLEASNIPVHFIGVRRSGQLWTAVRRLTVLLERQSPQLLQTLLFHANTVGALAARKLPGCRVIAGLRVAEPRPCRWLVQRRLGRYIDRFVCVSHAVASYAQNRGRLPAERLVVIPNGIDTEMFANAQPANLENLGIPRGRHVTACVARLDRQKGLDELIHAAPLFLEKFPKNFLLLVGDGPQRERLTHQMASSGLIPSVRFAGFRSDVPAILKACNLFVLPSHYEGMPHALMEAMSSGLAVVASRVEGVSELLGPLTELQTFAPGDRQGLAERIIHLAGDPNLALSLGRQNKQRVAQHFSVESMISQYEKLYLERAEI